MQFLFGGMSYWGGVFFFTPDRTVCGPPPLEANLFTFRKGSLVYKRYVWVLPIPYPLSSLIAYSLFPIPYPLFPPSPLIAYSLSPITPYTLIAYSLFTIYC